MTALCRHIKLVFAASAEHAELKVLGTDKLTRNQNNVLEWNYISNCRPVFIPFWERGILFYVCPSVAFFSVTVDGRNLIFGHKLHIQYRKGHTVINHRDSGHV